MKRHFVTFFSPGTLVAETTTKPIKDWNVETAQAMARNIKERYSALPYGFQFSTRERKDDELYSKEIAKSNMYYLGGEVLTLEEVKKRPDLQEGWLVTNMEGNGWDRVVYNTNSWSWTRPLKEGDVVLENDNDC